MQAFVIPNAIAEYGQKLRDRHPLAYPEPPILNPKFRIPDPES